ncbi:MAG: CDP-alcohol phosphatidyltransferase family protein [Bacteroidetes bacterium]|nr:CDP-alcohol phosphatidyltransferase family protein [Bacteroidota bacterium]MDA1119077.1 CDP-alcohol phosphatidyltransferase family protein [Bacteroidota bacterium]
MTLTEKLLRQLSALKVAEAIVVSPDGHRVEESLRKDFKKWHNISVKSEEFDGSEVTTLKSLAKEWEGGVVVLQGNTIVDGRVLELLINRAKEGKFCQIKTAENKPYAFSINGEQLKENTDQTIDTLKDFLASREREIILTSEMDSYIGSMRRRMEPFLFSIDDSESLKKAEKIAFISIYKGATDFITKYAWPLPTRLMVHLISPTGITPNQITYISMVLSFGAIPFFFMGWFWPAWIMGIVMSFLDTLDGKLARLTLRTSEAGHWLDNASDTIYLWLWYLGIGWYFSENLFDFTDINTQASWALVGFFTIDKIITGLFKKLFGAQLHDFGPIDYHARIFIARRNPFLVVLLVGLIIGQPEFGLYAMAIWQTATFAFHMMRFIYLPLSGQKHQVNS